MGKRLLFVFGGPIGIALALLSLPGLASDVAGWAAWLAWVDSRTGRWLLPIAGFSILAGLVLLSRPRAAKPTPPTPARQDRDREALVKRLRVQHKQGTQRLKGLESAQTEGMSKQKLGEVRDWEGEQLLRWIQETLVLLRGESKHYSDYFEKPTALDPLPLPFPFSNEPFALERAQWKAHLDRLEQVIEWLS